jgi:hypothetical protein
LDERDWMLLPVESTEWEIESTMRTRNKTDLQ